MATDHYGNVVGVGDVVTNVGTSPEFTVTEVSGEMLKLAGWHADGTPAIQTRVQSSNVIVK